MRVHNDENTMSVCVSSSLPTAFAQFCCCLRGCLFQLRSLSGTMFFVQTAVLTPICFALMKIVAAFVSDKTLLSFQPGMIWVDAAVAGLWASTTTAVGIIGYQRFLGTLQYLALSIMSPSVVFLPVVAASALLGMLGLPGAIIVVAIVSPHYFSVSALQLVGYMLAMLSCVASATFLAGIFVLFTKATAYEPLILIPVWMLCGIVVPLETMAMPFRCLALLHPLTAAVWVAHANSWNLTALIAILWSIMLSVVLFLISARMLRYAMKRAIQEGSLQII